MSAKQLLLPIQAGPTKDFFIRMLTRDIELTPAIIDLVDNSVDGARRLRPGGELAGLHVALTFDGTRFSIEDNCGGISINTAQNYAFRFGRPEEAGHDSYSIGQFGVGMKRSLFKLGSAFHVDSRTAKEAWKMDVDVNEWRTQSDWTFQLQPEQSAKPKSREPGTRILVKPLLPTVSRDLAGASRYKEICDDLQRIHQEAIRAGLDLSVNGVRLTAERHLLDKSTKLHPHVQTVRLGRDVLAKVAAGVRIGQKPPDAGWLIFCNGRLVLGPDQTKLTGWGEGASREMPRFHNEYRFFRGYVFFHSEDSERLPWTTTKTGIDENSEAWIQVRRHMLDAMRPITTWLSKLTASASTEAKGVGSPADIEAAARRITGKTATVEVTVKTRNGAWKELPIKPGKSSPSEVTIKYEKPKSLVDRVKRELGVSAANDAGAKTFEYYCRNELGVNDEQL